MSEKSSIFVVEIETDMKYSILQLDYKNENVRRDHRMYVSWDYLNQTCGFSKLCYEKVYDGEIEFDTSIQTTLDNIFRKFNLCHPNDFKGHSLSTSDVVVLDGVMYYCDSIGWVDIKADKKL